MTAALRTPGPWHIFSKGKYPNSDLIKAHISYGVGYDGPLGPVANIEFVKPGDLAVFAAANDMLTALFGLAGILATAESNASGNPEWEAVSAKVNAARAAIARATGAAS